MSCGIKAAYEHEENEYYNSEKYLQEKALADEWNSLLEEVSNLTLKNFTLKELQFLLSLKQADADFAYYSNRADPKQLDQLRDLVKRERASQKRRTPSQPRDRGQQIR